MRFFTNIYSGAIDVYVAKDYSGNIPFSYQIPSPEQESGQSIVNWKITRLMFSPDGYVLFAASEAGWHLWSVYGHLLSSNFLLDRTALHSTEISNKTLSEGFMDGVRDCCWAWSGLTLILLANQNRCFYTLPLSRSAATTCYNPVFQNFGVISWCRIR